MLALDVPVGCCHGKDDSNAPISAVKALEARAKEAGKTNIAFRYFPDLDHAPNIQEYFVHGTRPAGHQAIFQFIDRAVDRVALAEGEAAN